jgi:hypothetical protein
MYTDNRGRTQDKAKQILHQGTLWKLNSNGNADNPSHWLMRDTWVTAAGSLCYFSQKEGKRLVLLDASVLSRAAVYDFKEDSKAHVFAVSLRSEFEHEEDHVHMFKCKAKDDRMQWCDVLKHSISINSHAKANVRVSTYVVKDLSKTLRVHNNRSRISNSAHDRFEPYYRGRLWKLKTDGDRRAQSDWLLRDMWLSKNGSLVYWSQRDERELIYHTSIQISRASIIRAVGIDVCKSNAFYIRLPATGDLHTSPSFFAAESNEMLEQWIIAFSQFAYFVETKQSDQDQKRYSSDQPIKRPWAI